MATGTVVAATAAAARTTAVTMGRHVVMAQTRCVEHLLLVRVSVWGRGRGLVHETRRGRQGWAGLATMVARQEGGAVASVALRCGWKTWTAPAHRRRQRRHTHGGLACRSHRWATLAAKVVTLEVVVVVVVGALVVVVVVVTAGVVGVVEAVLMLLDTAARRRVRRMPHPR